MQATKNKYNYLDPINQYTLKNGVLRNLPNIEDEKVLLAYESLKVSNRIEELFDNPIRIVDSSALLKIHKHLFQDLYVWAGEKRIIEISKDGKQFFPTSNFDNAFVYIDHFIAEFNEIPKDNKKLLADKLAQILDNINSLHPFREGNGRTQREFLRLLALEKGLNLNLNPPDNKSIYERYMKGTIESDVKTLTELIFELIDTNYNL